MKAILVKPNGKRKNIDINSYDEARQIVCNFDADGDVMQISCPYNIIVLLDMNHKIKKYKENKKIGSYCRCLNLISKKESIYGDVLIIDSIAEFENLPYYLSD